MSENNKSIDHVLGMDRCITRRDFVNGVGVTLGAAVAWSALPQFTSAGEFATTAATGDYYPPKWTGLRGQTDKAYQYAHALRDGKRFPKAAGSEETYDLVIVGAGISGLSSAYFYQRRFPEARILLLDNCDDFGGHARRNEFDVDGKKIYSRGGAIIIYKLDTYPLEARELLEDLGFDFDKHVKQTASEMTNWHDLGIGRMATFFDKETFGKDALVMDGLSEYPTLQEPLDEFLAAAPLKANIKDGLRRLYAYKDDPMPGLSKSEKLARLQTMRYDQYLSDYIGLDEETLDFLDRITGGTRTGSGMGGYKSVGARWALEYGAPGFTGLGIEPQSEFSPFNKKGEAQGKYIHLPDGNHTVARLLVRRLIPGALAGNSVEDSIDAHLDYVALDKPDSPVRLRLNSTVVEVTHNGDPESSSAVYVQYIRDDKVHRVQAGACVMACFNAMVPHLCPELGEPQKTALHHAVRKPLLATNVVLRSWKPFMDLGISEINFVGKYMHRICHLAYSTRIGSYRTASDPSEPIALDLHGWVETPGLSPDEQSRAGRALLLQTPFEAIEREVREQLSRALAGTGFDAARDIAAITVNRWSHGYARVYNHALDPQWRPGEQPWVVGRQRLGRIAIANSDAGAGAHMQAAMDQAHRAVSELVHNVIVPPYTTVTG